MNPIQMAAEYDEFLERLRRDQSQLDEYNLGRLDEPLGNLINVVGYVIDELHAFR